MNEIQETNIPGSLFANRKIFLMKDINEETSLDIIGQLLVLNDKNTLEPIHFFINSIGGETDAGLAIYDIMRSIDSPVYTYCLGSCCSMAAILLAAGDIRFAFESADIMIHQPSGGVRGKSEEIRVYSTSIEKVKIKLVKILSKHTGQTIKKILEDFTNDYWMSAKEAKKYGIVDLIIKNNKLKGG